MTKDVNVVSKITKRGGGMFGWGYFMRRSSGASCHKANGRRICEKIHLCPRWPCPSDYRRTDGGVDYAKWAGFPPLHLVWCHDGWPNELADDVAPGGPEAAPEGGGPGGAPAPEGAAGAHAGTEAAPALGGQDGAPAGATAGAEAAEVAADVAGAAVNQTAPTCAVCCAAVGTFEGGACESCGSTFCPFCRQHCPERVCDPCARRIQVGPGGHALSETEAGGDDDLFGAEGGGDDDLFGGAHQAPVSSSGSALAGATLAVASAMSASGDAAKSAKLAAADILYPKAAPLQVREAAPPQGGSHGGGISATAAAPAAAVAATCAEEGADVAAGVQCYDKLLALSRELRSHRKYVGYSAFLIFSLLRKIRVFVWEGSNRIDLCKVFLPAWALESVSTPADVDAVFCGYLRDEDGKPRWAPVSASLPAASCSHYVCGLLTDVIDEGGDDTCVDGYYAGLGVVIISTLADGDCGLDVMLHMEGKPSTFEARKNLRHELADYLVQMIKIDWFQDLMAATQEVTFEEVRELRRMQDAVARGALAQPPGTAAAAAAADKTTSAADICEELLKAISWWTGVKEESTCLVIAEDLMPAERDEQIRLYRSRDSKPQLPAQKFKRLVAPSLFKSRMEVAGAFDEHLRAAGWSPGSRIPYGLTRSFMDAWDWGGMADRSLATRAKYVRRCHRVFLKSGYAKAVAEASLMPTSTEAMRAQAQLLKWKNRKRNSGAGVKRQGGWLRKELYEWWSGMRLSIDWKSVKSGCPAAAEHPRLMARFSQALLKQKANELVGDYCTRCVRHGRRPKLPQLDSRWWREWRKEYGLSLRSPNRKFKCPRKLVEERLERGWLNVFRVRAACDLLNGYEMEMENWDQSPFHHNETGSANVKTLAIKGKIVPLVEGHSATRERWTANFMTFSDKDRLRRDGPPPMECMFKAEGGGEKLLSKLKAHLLERGHPPWVSVATSTKGSYRTPDVLAFLQLHMPELPPHPQQREWRIMMADDHGPHLSPLVSKLCWSRGYVFIPHGGGVTPILQTVDTHLNHHVKREYIKKEGAELLRKMRLGQFVPQLRYAEMIDLMVEVMSAMALHLAAAEGYWETGMKANIWDSNLDRRIVKEAGYFWGHLQMRGKIAEAVAEVRTECEAGRLRWCYKDIMNLIIPHPRCNKSDEILSRLGEDTALDAGDNYLGGSGDGGADAQVIAEEVGDDNDDDDDGDLSGDGQDLEEWALHGASAGGNCSEIPAAAGVSDIALPPGVSEQQMQDAADASELEKAYERIADELRSWGDVCGSAFMELQRDKERRRLRELSKEDADVMEALAAYQDAKAASERKAKRLRDEEARRRSDLDRVTNDVRKARKMLQDQQARLAINEQALAIKNSVKRYSLAELGQGHRNGGPAVCRTARSDVLVRVSGLGNGLSAAQRSEFDWFRKAWDQAGIDDFGDQWAETFSTWIQNVLEEHELGNANAFSMFVHNETRRRLAGTLALTLPPVRPM